MTVSASSCLTGVSMVAPSVEEAGRHFYMREAGIDLVYLSQCTPLLVAGTRISQISIGSGCEAACCVESRGKFVGERLVVNKTISV